MDNICNFKVKMIMIFLYVFLVCMINNSLNVAEAQFQHPLYSNMMQHSGIYEKAKSAGDAQTMIVEAANLVKLGESVYKNDNRTIINMYENFALDMENIEAVDKACEYYIKAIDIGDFSREAGPDELVILCNKIANLFQRTGQYTLVNKYCQKSLSFAEKGANDKGFCIALTLNTLGLLHANMGNYKTALKSFNEALSYAEKSNDSDKYIGISRIYCNMGQLYNDMNDYDLAIDILQKSKNILTKTSKPGTYEIAYVYNNMGIAYTNKGEYDRALGYFNQAVDVFRMNFGPRSVLVASVYSNMISAYTGMKLYSRAIEYGRLAERIIQTKTVRYNPLLSVYYSNIGVAYHYAKDFNMALDYYIKAQNIKEKYLKPDHPDFALSYHNIGNIYLKKKEYINAINYLKKAADLVEKSYGDELLLCLIFNSMGGAYLEMGDYASAVQSLRRALNIAKKYRSLTTVIALSQNLGLSYFKMAEYNKARSAFREGVDFLEQSLVTTGSSRLLSIAQNNDNYYYSLIANAKLQDLHGMFEVSERMRAHDYIDRLRLKTAISAPGITPSDAEKIMALNDNMEGVVLERIQELTRIERMPDSKKLASISHRVEKIEEEYNNINERLMKNERYRNLRRPELATLSDAQALCGPQTAILVYTLWETEHKDRGSYCMVITSKDIKLVELDKDIKYSNKVAQLRDAIINSDMKTAENCNNLLYQKLIAPLDKYLPDCKRVIIIPDGGLSFCPFDFLRPNLSSSYLCQRLSISIYPSVSVMKMLKKRNYSADRYEYIGFGGAIYERNKMSPPRHRRLNVEGRTISLEERESLEKNDENDFRKNYYSSLKIKWDNLPQTTKEVMGIERDVFSNIRTRTIIGKDSTEESIKRLSASGDLKHYKAIHFACHGYFDPNNPVYSAVVLSEVSDASSRGEDGYLSVEEISLLMFQADIVNLSACETGLGAVVRGYGIVGLARAFQVAGANRVGVTLWKVDDEATKDFMVAVYRKVVKEKMSFGAAYNETKCEFIESKKYSDPYFWSPFVLYGE